MAKRHIRDGVSLTDVTRILLIAVLGVLGWISRDVTVRLRRLELNQVQIMTVLGVEPVVVNDAKRRLSYVLPLKIQVPKESKDSKR